MKYVCTVCGFEWNPTPNSLLRGNGCPNCSHKNGWNVQELTREIHNYNEHFQSNECSITGQVIIKGKIEAVCNLCGRKWMARYSDLLRGLGCGCNSSRKNRVICGVNDVLTKAPFLEKEWNFEKNKELNPANLAARSSKKVWWTCSLCGYEWQAAVSSRTAGHGCPKCYKEGKGKKKSREYSKSLAALAPSLLEEWSSKNSIRPTEIAPYSKQKVLWTCKKGHEWCASVGNRFRGSGCPYCNRKRVLAGFNDLKSTNPEVALEWDYQKNTGITPEQVLSGSHKKVWWKCKNGHEGQAVINDRSNGSGCPICYKHKMV